MYDFIIVGQGLAGTSLAWTLINRGQRVLVLDRGDPVTASRIAAGLMTPVIGKRLTVPWRFQQFRTAAIRHYRQMEQQTHSSLLTERPAIRLFQNEPETAAWEKRKPELTGMVTSLDPEPADGIICQRGGFQMPNAMMLNVPRYLEESRQAFTLMGAYQQTEIAVSQSEISGEQVVLNDGAFVAHQVVCCLGFAATGDTLFSGVRFDATKGEILTVRIPGLTETRTIHAAGFWLAPTNEPGLYRFGATYDWDDLTTETTEAAREKLAERLQQVVSLPFEIVGQQAAVRPTVIGRHPILGRHPKFPRVSFFNGLGSKGALTAPGLAELLTEHLLDGQPLLPEVDIAARWHDHVSDPNQLRHGAV